jgi:tetratricopeptide (TPR) repeat protein
MKPSVVLTLLPICFAGILSAQPPVSYFSISRDSAAHQKAFYLNNADEIEEHANRLFNQGNFAAALLYYDRLVGVQPGQWRFYFGRGRCLEEMQATNEAIENYDYALTLNPDFADALFNRANLRFQKELYGFVIADMDQLIKLPDEKMPPTNAIYFVQGNAGTTGVFSMKNHKMLAYRLRAKAKEKTGEIAGAIDDYTAAIGEGQIADADLYYARGNLYKQLGRAKEAQQDFQRALVKDPHHQQAILALGISTEKLQKNRLQAILIEQPENALALAQRGSMLLEEKKYAAALTDFDSAEYYGYREPALYINRGITKEKLNKLDAALADFSHAIRIVPSVKAYNLRANCYFKKGNYESAIADYTQSLALDANQADVYYNRGIACHYARRKKEACANLQTAISLGHQAAQAAYDKLCN